MQSNNIFGDQTENIFQIPTIVINMNKMIILGNLIINLDNSIPIKQSKSGNQSSFRII